MKKTNWPRKKLEDICDFQNGLWTGKKSPFIIAKVIRNTNFKNNDGTLNYGDVAEVEVEERQLGDRLLEKGDLLLERSGGGPTQPVGRVVYFDADGKFSFSNFTSRIRIKNLKELDSIFLWRYLNFLYISGVTEKLQKQTTGIRNLNFADYKNLEIPLPPLSEQKRIVGKLEKLLGKIKEAKKLRAESLESTQNLLPSELHKIFSEGKEKGWEEKELHEVAESVADGTHDSPQYQSEGFPLITSKNLKPGGLTFDTAKFISGKDYELINKRSSVSNGDILIGMIGTVGNVTRVNTEKKFAIKNVGLIRPNNKKVLADYIVYYLDNSNLLNLITTGGTTQKFMALGMLRNIKIRYPSISEQKKIVAHLDKLSGKVEELKKLQLSTSAGLDSLSASILHQAFEGKL